MPRCPGNYQTCAGSTSFAGAPLRVSGSAEVTAHAHGFGVGLTLGGTATFFGVSLGTTHLDALNGSSFDVAAGGGYELPHVRLIPTLGLGFEHAQQTFSRLGSPSVTASHGFGVPALAVGVVFGKTVTVLPEALVPIGLAGGSAAFGLGFAANFGR